MKYSKAIFSLYWFAIFFGLASYCASRGPDGNFLLFVVLFPALAIAYAVAMPVCFSKKWTLHSLGHLAVFLALSLAALALNPRLDGMAGMLNYIVPAAVALAVALGAVSLLFISSIRTRRNK